MMWLLPPEVDSEVRGAESLAGIFGGGERVAVCYQDFLNESFEDERGSFESCYPLGVARVGEVGEGYGVSVGPGDREVDVLEEELVDVEGAFLVLLQGVENRAECGKSDVRPPSGGMSCGVVDEFPATERHAGFIEVEVVGGIPKDAIGEFDQVGMGRGGEGLEGVGRG